MRPANPADIPTMLELHRENSTSPWSREQYDSLFRAHKWSAYFMLVVEDPSESRSVTESASTSSIVAHLVAQCVGSEWHLQYIVVANKSRRRGLATMLMRELIAHARSKNASQIFLEVRASNQAAQVFYDKMGFKVIRTRKNYYPPPRQEDAVDYVLLIS
jgi:ribosomal-protein-alanine N-acetyltransferase